MISLLIVNVSLFKGPLFYSTCKIRTRTILFLSCSVLSLPYTLSLIWKLVWGTWNWLCYMKGLLHNSRDKDKPNMRSQISPGIWLWMGPGLCRLILTLEYVSWDGIHERSCAPEFVFDKNIWIRDLSSLENVLNTRFLSMTAKVYDRFGGVPHTKRLKYCPYGTPTTIKRFCSWWR